MRSFWYPILMTLTLGVAGQALAADETLFEFQAGDGARSVGIIAGSEEVEASGPAALSIGDDGTVYVLDQNNGRVLSLDPQRAAASPDILPLPDDVAPEDLAVVHNALYLWSDGVVPLEKTPAPAGGQSLRAADAGGVDAYARSVFASMGSVSPGPLNSITEEIGRSVDRRERPPVIQYVPSRGLGDVVAELRIKDQKQADILLRRSGSDANFLSLALTANQPLGSVELIDIDTTGRAYALVELIGDLDETGMMVVRFTPEGKMERAFDLPIDGETVFSRRFIAIAPRGDVMFLQSEEARARVMKLGGRAPGKKLVAERPAKQKRVKNQGKPAKLAFQPKSRNSIIERAIGFETLSWRVTDGAYGANPGPKCASMNRLRRPLYLIGKLGQTVQGVPYCWGCKTSLDSFASGVAAGKPAGNVCTKSAPQSSFLGVDCSAFVSEAWGLKNHVVTASIPSVARRLSDPWSLQPGDALNKPGSHVMLFMRFTGDRKVEVMESSPNACKGRVCRNTYSLGTLLMRGYQPVRFKGIDS